MKSSDYAPLPTVFYLTSLDSYIRRRLKAFSGYFDSQDSSLISSGNEDELNAAILDVAEALIIGDGVALKLTGENTALALLVRAFGPRSVDELLHEGKLRFIEERFDPGSLVNPAAALVDGKSAPPGNPIVMTIDYSGFEPHVYPGGTFDAQESARVALTKHKRELNLDRGDIRNLFRLATRRTRSVPGERLNRIMSRVGDAYVSGALASFGLSPEIARTENVYQDHEYVALITRIAYTETLLDFDLDQYQMPERWNDILKFTASVSSGNTVLRSVDRVMELRNIADIRSLFTTEVLELSDIARVSGHRATKDFRRWLWSKPDPRDGAAISRAFVDDVSGKRTDIANRSVFRSIRTATIALIQDLVIEHLGAPPEARVFADMAGAVISDTAIERLKRKPPSAFFDEVVEPAMNEARLLNKESE